MAKKSSKPQEAREYKCSFCNKPHKDVNRLISGPHGVYICDECAKLCLEIIEEEFPQAPKRPVPTDPELYIDMLAKISETTGIVAQYSENLPPEVLGHLAKAALVLTTSLTRRYEALLQSIERIRQIEADERAIAEEEVEQESSTKPS